MRRLLAVSLFMFIFPALAQTEEITLPMHRDRTGQLSVSLTLNGVPARLLVDTGANVSTMDRSRQAFLPDGEMPESAAPGAPPQVELSVAYRLRSIGAEQFTLLDLSFINVGAERMGTPPFDGQLGASFFEQHHAVIDFHTMTIRLDASGSSTNSEVHGSTQR